MRLSGSERLPAPRAALAAVLGDPERLAAALPHVDDFARLDDGGFEATLRPALALGEVPVRTVWRRAGGELAYEIEGRGDEHTMSMRADVRLDGSGSETTVTWELDCGFTGTVRSAGQRVLGAIVRHQVSLVLAAAAREARS